jgi:hypothetical protein
MERTNPFAATCVPPELVPDTITGPLALSGPYSAPTGVADGGMK